jgi:hypothetical protein
LPLPCSAPLLGGRTHASVLVPASSAKHKARWMQSGGMSRGQNHSSLRLRRGQDRAT